MSWCLTLDGLVRPTASPISRMLGGYPRDSTDDRMVSSTSRWRAVRPSDPGAPSGSVWTVARSFSGWDVSPESVTALLLRPAAAAQHARPSPLYQLAPAGP